MSGEIWLKKNTSQKLEKKNQDFSDGSKQLFHEYIH